jgi:hypothetical protein
MVLSPSGSPPRAVEVGSVAKQLLDRQNADGGWGYHAGKASRLEPTSWALLALNPRATPGVLQKWPVAKDLLLERPGGEPNYAFQGLALLVMRALSVSHAKGTEKLLSGIQRVKGEKLAPSRINQQDTSLQAWSWIPETASWVEPTAWCLLALKHWARIPGTTIDKERVEVAERVLVDRCHVNGGWNYGNSNMLGQQLEAFVPTTAIALLAMKDRASLPEIERSVAFLEREAVSERSGTALSLAYIALTAFGRADRARVVRETLVAQLPTTVALGNQMAMAMALYALKGDHAALVL